jgi:hypothetical protein
MKERGTNSIEIVRASKKQRRMQHRQRFAENQMAHACRMAERGSNGTPGSDRKTMPGAAFAMRNSCAKWAP